MTFPSAKIYQNYTPAFDPFSNLRTSYVSHWPINFRNSPPLAMYSASEKAEMSSHQDPIDVESNFEDSDDTQGLLNNEKTWSKSKLSKPYMIQAALLFIIVIQTIIIVKLKIETNGKDTSPSTSPLSTF
jgi:hypothetical protein